jgi:site-specific recombinase XerD
MEGIWVAVRAAAPGGGRQVPVDALHPYFCRRALFQGIDIQTVRDLMGHSSISTTQI